MYKWRAQTFDLETRYRCRRTPAAPVHILPAIFAWRGCDKRDRGIAAMERFGVPFTPSKESRAELVWLSLPRSSLRTSIFMLHTKWGRLLVDWPCLDYNTEVCEELNCMEGLLVMCRHGRVAMHAHDGHSRCTQLWSPVGCSMDAGARKKRKPLSTSRAPAVNPFHSSRRIPQYHGCGAQST